MYLDEKQIDWKALRVAKIAMVRLGELDIPRLPLTDLERASCNQMIYLLDYIQDQAEETALDTPKSDIFTHAEIEEDCEAMGLEFSFDVNKDPSNIAGRVTTAVTGLEFVSDVNEAPFHLVDDNDDWIDAFMTEEKAVAQRKHIIDFCGVNSRIIDREEWREISHRQPAGK
jgi:hypothetical protein